VNKGSLEAVVKIVKKDSVLLNKRFSVSSEIEFYLASAEIAHSIAKEAKEKNPEVFPIRGVFRIQINLSSTSYYPNKSTRRKSVLIKFRTGIKDIENIRALLMTSIQSAFESMGKSVNIKIA
jgi:hypothetical protein